MACIFSIYFLCVVGSGSSPIHIFFKTKSVYKLVIPTTPTARFSLLLLFRTKIGCPPFLLSRPLTFISSVMKSRNSGPCIIYSLGIFGGGKQTGERQEVSVASDLPLLYKDGMQKGGRKLISFYYCELGSLSQL